MKKLLTLLLTAVIGCLPMWAGAGTDTYGYGNITLKSITNGNLPTSNTGAVYKSDKLTYESTWRAFYFNNSTTAIEVVSPADGCIIESISMTPRAANASSAPTLEIYGANSPDYSDESQIGKLDKDNTSANIEGEYAYFRLKCTYSSTTSRLTAISFTWKENAPKVCETPTVSANYWVPEGTVTLTAPTEGSTLTYSWGVDAESDVATATGTTVEGAASPATITIPADAEVGKTFWVRATAKLDGYADSEELNYTHVLGSNVLAAPTFNHPSGEIEKGTWLYIERPNNATTIHYTVNGGEEQTSTDYSVGMTIDENTTIVAYATGNAPFKESEKVTYSYTVVTPTVDTPTIWPETGILPGTTLYLNADQDAYLTYSWGIKNGDIDVVKNEEETIQDSYVDITVPNDNIEVGYTLWVNATAKRDGYNDSKPLNFTYTFEAVKLDAPTFSLQSSEDLMPGTEVTINMPSHATTLHYTVNNGEEQTSNENVTLTINVNTDVVAWATGEGLYTKSDDATASYKVLGDNVDVLVPTMWEDFTAGAYQFAEHGTATGKTGVKYEFNGGYDVVNGVNTFYFNDYYTSILYNKTGKKILRIKLETPLAKTVYMYLSDVAPVTVYNSSPTFGFYDASDYGVWKDAQEAKSGAQYFGIWGSVGQVSRILIEYEDTSVGVEGIAAENGEAMYFDLNGAKVNSLENAVPGVYVRVANGKATKVLVK
jgi:lipoprotein